jgi:ribonucleoside-diphosphate reductase beta chain
MNAEDKKKNIFEARVNILPYEYPQLLAYKDAIRHSYWIDTEYNFTTDIDDFRVKVTDEEREVIKRMPITEIGDVGMTFAESEVRHKDAYARLLRILGLEEEFRTVIEIPAIEGRIKYLKKYLDGSRSKDNKMYTKSVLLFSLFIEHVSLFSQFLIMMSFNKEKNLFKGISNVVEATSKEEDIHGNFGAELINIIRSENPEWFDQEFEDLIYSACNKAYIAECDILDWIFEKGELDFLPKENIRQFIMNRFNNSLAKIGMKPLFYVDSSLLEKTHWFDVEITATKEGDFFYKKQIDYNKKSKAITEDDLF